MAFKIDPVVLQTVMKTAVEGEAELIKTLEADGKDEKQIMAQVAMFRVQKSYADQLSTDDVVALGTAAGFELTKKAAKKPAEKDDEGDDEEEDGPPMFGKKKSKKKAEGDDKMEKSKKSDDESLGAKLDLVLKSMDTMSKENAELRSTVKSLTDDKVTRTFVTKAANELADIPGSAEEVGAVLKSAFDVSEAHGKAVEGLLVRANKAAGEASILTKSIGSAGADKVESSAMAQIEKLAQDMVTKSTDSAFTIEQARDMVLKSERGQKLYNQYLSEHPEQIGARA